MENLLLKGLVIGFSIAAPVGPIGVLCIRRTLADGRSSGLASGLGAATADAVYGAIAGFGLTIVSSFLLERQIWIRTVGGLFLLYLGIKTILASPSGRAAEVAGGNFIKDYFSTFILTITNPLTILSFVAIFAGLGLGSASGDQRAALLLIAGVFLGSAAWWLLLSTGVSIFRKQIELEMMHWINRISGLIILGFGIAAFVSIFLLQ
jgi:threonine/homoserine/homoserine lactone efflux protein